MSSPQSPYRIMHSYSRADPLAGRQGLAPGTFRRVVAFAKPHKRSLVWFLGLVMVDSLLVVATPLLFRAIVDDGVQQGNSALVTLLAGVIALIAVADAGLTLAQRWYSARIGEGLIYDLRTQVFSHVQRMPLAF